MSHQLGVELSSSATGFIRIGFLLVFFLSGIALVLANLLEGSGRSFAEILADPFVIVWGAFCLALLPLTRLKRVFLADGRVILVGLRHQAAVNLKTIRRVGFYPLPWPKFVRVSFVTEQPQLGRAIWFLPPWRRFPSFSLHPNVRLLRSEIAKQEVK